MLKKGDREEQILSSKDKFSIKLKEREYSSDKTTSTHQNKSTIVSHLEWEYHSKGISYSESIKRIILDLINNKNKKISLSFLPYEDELIENAFGESDEDSIDIREFINYTIFTTSLDKVLVDYDMNSKPILKEKKLALRIFPENFHDILLSMNGKNTHSDIVSRIAFSAIHYSRVLTILNALNLLEKK